MRKAAVESKRVFLVIEADEPALLFSSVKAAENYLEVTDVRQGTYGRVFGRGGERFKLLIVGDNVRIVPDLESQRLPNDLRDVLYTFLSTLDVGVSEQFNLDELLDKCDRFVDE